MNNPLRLFSFIRNIHIVLFSVIFCSPLILTSQVLLSESFNGVSLPAGWTATDLSGDGNWFFDNPYPRTINAGSTAFDAAFAIYDSDYLGLGGSGNEEAILESPAFDASALGNYFLDFDNSFYFYTLGVSKGIVEVFDGTTWTPVLTISGASDGYPTANHKTIDITAATGNSPAAKVRFLWKDGNWDYYWAIDNVKVTYLANCVGVPTVGTATSEMFLVCPTDVFRLDVPKVYAGGITYRWEASTDGGVNWSFVSAASADTFYVISNQIVNTQYRAVVYCGTDSAVSNVLIVNNKPLDDCYCTPVYTSGCVNNDYISDFVLGAFSNSSGNNCGTAEFLATGYASYLSLTPGPQIIRGDVDSVFITNGTQGSAYYAIWVDLNNNGTYETSERIGFTTTAAAAGSVTKIFVSVPAATPPGFYRMRVRLVRGTTGSAITPCGSYGNGEVEEYMLEVINQPSCSTVPVPSSITPTASNSVICVSENIVFDITTIMPNVLGYTYQWESSTDGGTTWNAAGAVKSTHKDTIAVNTTADYRLNILCEGSNVAYSDTLQLTVLNPQIVTYTDSLRCGYGSVTLEATSSAGTSLSWYANPTGGSALGVGNVFNTPNISTTTTYYVAAIASGGTSSLGRTTPTVTTGFVGGGTGLVFNATSSFSLIDATIYPVGTGTVTIQLTDNLGTVISTTPAINVSGNGTTPVVIPLNFAVNPGTGYRLLVSTYTGITDLIREASIGGFPYNSSGGEMSITSGYNAGAPNTSYYYFYNMTILSGCQSARQPVVATVVPAPSISVTASDMTICKGNTTDLSVSSSNAGYTYTWLPGNLSGANQTVSPTVSTEYVVLAEDLTTGPFENCAITDTITINVDSVSLPIINVYPDTVCSGDTVTFGVSNSTKSLQNTQVVLDDIDYLSPFSYLYDATKAQYILRANELMSLGFQANTEIHSFAIEVVGNAGVVLKDFSVSIGATSVASTSAGVYATGLTTIYSAATYQPTLGLNTFVLSTPFIWDGVSNLAIQFCHDNGCFVYDYFLTPYVRGEELSDEVAGYTLDDCLGSMCSYGMDYTDYTRPIFTFDIQNGANSYVWNPVGVAGSTVTTNPINSTNAPMDVSYTLDITNTANNCTASAPLSVHVYPEVNAVITSTESVICANDQDGFYIDAQTNSSPGSSFTWLSDNSIAPTFLVIAPGTYIVKAENAYGCMDYDTIVIGLVQPVVPIISIGVAGGYYTLDAGAGFLQYLWNTLEITQSIEVSTNGTYYVEVVDSNGCTVVSDPVVIQGIGVSEDGSKIGISLFPNPSNGLFAVQLDNVKDPSLRLDIMDISGKVIMEKRIDYSTAGSNIQLDLTSMADGTYFLRIYTSQSVYTQKIIIVK